MAALRLSREPSGDAAAMTAAVTAERVEYGSHCGHGGCTGHGTARNKHPYIKS
jgi:hypothetical protein